MYIYVYIYCSGERRKIEEQDHLRLSGLPSTLEAQGGRTKNVRTCKIVDVVKGE